MNSKFKDPKRVMVGMLSIIAGVMAYCFLVAPPLSDDTYWGTASHQFMDKGIGYSAVVIAIGAVWMAVIFFSRREKKSD